jgi:three-Cys-motif partner protein
MKEQKWQTIYFDGFAGSGTKEKKEPSELYQQLHLLPAEERLYKGAAERVLTAKDGLSFDFYYFIDKKQSSLDKLKERLESKGLAADKKLMYKPGDANLWILELAAAMKAAPDKFAALIFLDPFGMQIDWSSIEAIGGTRSDVWILVPTGVIVNRLLDKAGALTYSDLLERFFGLPLDEIRQHFYRIVTKQTLFGEGEFISKVSQPIGKIARLYAERLASIWSHVTTEPLRLDNRNGVPIFHLVFASNNATALKIAKQIIQNV